MSQNQSNANPCSIVTLGLIRFCYVKVFEAVAAPGSTDLKYSLQLRIPKSDTALVEQIKAAILAAVEKGKKDKWGGTVPAGLKQPLRDGDKEKPGEEEFKGHYFINASNTLKPGLVDANLQKIINPSDFYSGCYGRVDITFYPFNTQNNLSRGIACSLNNIQKLQDGEPLAGGQSAEAAFGGTSAPAAPAADDSIFN